MSERADRREKIRAYKESPQAGGLYRIVNTITGWKGPVAATPNLKGMANRLAFAVNTKACFDASLADIWDQTQGEGFSLEELERLERKPDQSSAEFAEDLHALLSLYLKHG